MPQKAKRACQAEAQCASGLQFFDRGFVDKIKEYTLDPSYEPTPDELAEDSATSSSIIMVLHVEDFVTPARLP